MRWTKIDIPIGGSLDEITEDWKRAASKLDSAMNVWQDRHGGWRVRPGHVALSESMTSGETVASWDRVLGWNDQTLAVATIGVERRLVAYDEAQDKWNSVGRVPECRLEGVNRAVPSTQEWANVDGAKIAVSGAYAATIICGESDGSGAISDGATVYVRHTPTKTPVMSVHLDGVLSSGRGSTIIGDGTGQFYVIYVDNADVNLPLEIVRIDPSIGTYVGSQIAFPAVASTAVDASMIDASELVIGATMNVSGTAKVTLYRVSVPVVGVTSYKYVDSDTASSLSIDGDDTYGWAAAWVTNRGGSQDYVRYAEVDHLFASTTTPVNIYRESASPYQVNDVGVCKYAAQPTRGYAVAFYALGRDEFNALYMPIGTATPTYICATHHATPKSAPVEINGELYMAARMQVDDWLSSVSALSYYHFGWWLRLTRSSYEGEYDSDADSWAQNNTDYSWPAIAVSRVSLRTHSHQVDSTVYDRLGHPALLAASNGEHGTMYVHPVGYDDRSGGVSVQYAVIEYGSPRDMIPADTYRHLVLSAGVPQIFDGANVVEYGFETPPVVESATSRVWSGGSLTGSAKYGIAVGYSWTDARGVRHCSVPSYEHTVTLGTSDNAITVECTNLALTQKQSATDEQRAPVQVLIFCTVHDGSTLYLVDRADNDVRAAHTTFTILTDPTGDEQIIYTDGGVLPHYQPPASKQIVSRDDRYWLISADDETMLLASSSQNLGIRLGGFPSQLSLTAFGRVEALANLDNKLVLLGEDRVDVIVGQPPNALGLQSTISGPQKLSVDVGCIDVRSVVEVPGGVIFGGQDMIHMIDRGLNVQPIGAGIMDAGKDSSGNYARPNYRSAVYDQRLDLVFIATKDYLLAYHLLFDAWSRWDDLGNTLAVCSRTALSSTGEDRVKFVHVADTSDGVRYLSETSSTMPPGTIGSYIITPWIDVSGLQGLGRVKDATFLFEGTAPSSITMIAYADYDASSASNSVTLSTPTFESSGRCQYRLSTGAQKAQSHRFAAVFTAPSSGQMRFIGLQLRARQKGYARVKEANKT